MLLCSRFVWLGFSFFRGFIAGFGGVLAAALALPAAVAVAASAAAAAAGLAPAGALVAVALTGTEALSSAACFSLRSSRHRSQPYHM